MSRAKALAEKRLRDGLGPEEAADGGGNGAGRAAGRGNAVGKGKGPASRKRRKVAPAAALPDPDLSAESDDQVNCRMLVSPQVEKVLFDVGSAIMCALARGGSVSRRQVSRDNNLSTRARRCILGTRPPGSPRLMTVLPRCLG